MKVAAWVRQRRVWAILPVVFLVGCSAKNPHPMGSFERGEFFAEHGHNLEAVGAFESFLRFHPTDDLASRAQFLKAKGYMELREYPLAAVEFQILRKDYPMSPLVEDAFFLEGEAYLFQVGKVERDLGGAYEARLHFLEFSQEYPASSYMPEVIAHLQEISDLVVRKRLGQVKVYRQLNRRQAAIVVLDKILADEPQSGLLAEVLWERGRLAELSGDVETAVEMYEDLIDQFPASEQALSANSALKSLRTAGEEKS